MWKCPIINGTPDNAFLGHHTLMITIPTVKYCTRAFSANYRYHPDSVTA